MSTPAQEVHLERLLGHRLYDVDGQVVGRLEEVAAEHHGDECVVTEFHVGPAALLERIARFVRQLPLLRALPFSPWEYRIPWQQVDLSDAAHPRVRCRRAELQRVSPLPGDSTH